MGGGNPSGPSKGECNRLSWSRLECLLFLGLEEFVAVDVLLHILGDEVADALPSAYISSGKEEG